MNILPALTHHLTQHHHPHQWKPVPTAPRPSHVVATTVHLHFITTHIRLIQTDNILTIVEETYHNLNISGTQRKTTFIDLLDPEFLEKIKQAIPKP